MRFSTIKTAVFVGCMAVFANAIQAPEDSPGATGRQQGMHQPFKRGLKGMRRAMTRDFHNEAADGSFSPSKRLQLRGAPATALPARLSGKFAHGDMQVRVASTTIDKYGVRHVKLQQYCRTMPVIGGEMIAHIDQHNQLLAVTGQWAPALSVVNPALPISRLKAKQAAAALLPDLKTVVRTTPRMVIFDGQPAYEIDLVSPDKQPVSLRCFVSAQSGEVLATLNRILHAGPGPQGNHTTIDGERLADEDGTIVSMTGWQDLNGNYFMYNKDSVWGVFSQRTGDWEQRQNASWENSDPAAVSLGRNLATVQNWVMGTLGMNSFDNQGIVAVGNVHEGYNYVNAYWDGEDFHFGDGDGYAAGPLTVLDIVGHEYGHALTQYTSNLVYAYEPGALNESYSDIVGTMVEFAEQPDGRDAYPGSLPGSSDWLCGEDCWLMDEALRDLRDPQRYGQPSFYQGTYWYTGDEDNGGVHYNSGVQNFAFYLLAEGGSGINDGFPYSINGLGLDAARDIALYANFYLLTANAQFRDSRNAWILAAYIMGHDTAAVRDVWTAVGLPPLEKHLEVSTTALDFGTVGFGETDTQWVDLINMGGEPTNVFSAEIDNARFSVTNTFPVIVPAGKIVRLGVAFAPSDYPQEQATLALISDALDNPRIDIALSGTGAQPARIEAHPQAISCELVYGDTASVAIIVTNTGEADLKFMADIAADRTIGALASLKKTSVTARKNSFAQKSGRTFRTDVTARKAASAHIGAAGSGLNVLYLNTIIWDSSSLDIFASQLGALENVAQLDVLNGEVNTPNSEYLQQYDVVVLSSNYPWADPVALGDALAEYVDNGGRIVMLEAVFAAGGSYGLGGRITSKDYMPLEMAGPTSPGYEASFEEHPITEGVTILESDILIESRSVNENGIALGRYSSGVLIGACHRDRPIVVINVFPTDYYWRGDLIRMMANTLEFLNKGKWLRVRPLRQKMVLETAQSCTLEAVLDARNVFGGRYESAVNLFHNDPSQPAPLVIPVVLDVDGIRLLQLEKTAIDFGTVWNERTRRQVVQIANPGSEPTIVNQISCSGAGFSVSAETPMVIVPGRRVQITVMFTPPASGLFEGTIIVSSDAENGTEQQIALSGSGVVPPVITWSPARMDVALDPSDLEQRTVRLTNSGGAPFDFTSSTVYQLDGAQDRASATLYGTYGGFIYRIDPVSGMFIGEGIRLDNGIDSDSTGSIGSRGLAFDGTTLYCSFGYSEEIVAFDAATGREVRRIPLPQVGSYTGLGVSDDYLITVNEWYGTIYVLDKITGQTVYSWSIDRYVFGALSYCGARNSVLLASDYEILECRLEDGTLLNSIPAPVYGINGLAYSAAAQVIFASSQYENDILVLDISNGSQIGRVTGLFGIDALAADEANGGWMRVEPASATVEPGEALDVMVTFNGTRVRAGNNLATLTFACSDPVNDLAPLTIPCALTVSEKRMLRSMVENVHFSDTWVNAVDTAWIVLANDGSMPVEVQAIQVKGARFGIGATLPLTVPAYGFERVRVFFRPIKQGSLSGQFTFVSNAQDNPKLIVPLSATAVTPPKIRLNVPSFNLTVLPGAQSVKPLTMTNGGSVDFSYVARARCSLLPTAQPHVAGDPAQATLFVLRGNRILQVNPATGEQVDDPIQTSLPEYTWEGGLAYDGRVLYAAASYDSVIYVINPYDGALVKTITIPNCQYLCGLGVVGNHLVVANAYPAQCFLVDRISGEVVGEWTIPTQYGYFSGALTGAGSRGTVFISHNDEMIIREYDVLSGAVVQQFQLSQMFALYGLAYSVSANVLIGADYMGMIVSMDPDGGAIVAQVESRLGYTIAGCAADEDSPPFKWVNLDVTGGTVAGSGGKVTTLLTFDTRDLEAGTYVGMIDIRYTGSRYMDPITVPCTLTVPQAGRLVISDKTVDFDTVSLNSSAQRQLVLSNPGNLPTTITTAIASKVLFTVDMTTPYVLAPNTSTTMNISFKPTKKGKYSALLVLGSDAAEGSVQSVSLKGVAIK